jgi:hypothetical protein
MKDENAAGRKTESQFEIVLSEQMALCRDAIADCFKEAREWSQFSNRVPLDDIVHNRSREIGSATNLLKACAELTLAAGKLKGEFDHRIRVTRDTAAVTGDPLPETDGSIPQ